MGLRGALRRRKARRRLARAIEAEARERARHPGPKWHRLPSCRHGVYDSGGAQIGARLYTFGGFRALADTSDSLDIYDMAAGRWLDPVPLPEGFPNSHAAVASDGRRHIYVVTGQVGPECRPAVASGFVLDTRTGDWGRLPDLPAPRYAGTMQLWRGRLHFLGGADVDRWTPRAEHWSLAVDEGRATEEVWREEVPIPVPGMHRGSIVLEDALYVIGGQQGDFMAIPGDPAFTCTAATEESYIAACFRLDAPQGRWARLRDLPLAASHIDFSVQAFDGRLLVLGGQVYKDETHVLRLSDLVQVYDPSSDRWHIGGHLPAPLKFPVTGLHAGRLVFSGGQKAGPLSDRPGPISNETWGIEAAALLPPSPDGDPVLPAGNLFDGRKILLLTHELSRTGAPMLLLETAQALIAAGAEVRLACPQGPRLDDPFLLDFPVPLVPLERAEALALKADLVIANTLAPAMTGWAAGALARNPFLARRLVVWVHEIDVEVYRDGAPLLERAAAALFDSAACRDTWASVARLPAGAAVIHPPLAEAFLAEADRPAFPLPRPLERSDTGGALLDRAGLRRALGFAEDDLVVLCIGQLEERKGQRLLLQTLARLAARGLPVKLVLVGFADARARRHFLRDLSRAERRVLRPEWAFLARSGIAPFYRLADVHVTNSQGANGRAGECFGRVTTEAMAHGLAVMGTASGGTSEIIEEGLTGRLYPTGTEGQEALAAHLEALIGDPAARAEMAKAGQDAARARFRQAEALRQFEAALAPLLSSRRIDEPA